MKLSGPVSVWLQDVAKGCWNSKSILLRHSYCRLAHTLCSGAAMSEGNGKCNYIVNLVKLNVMLQFGKGPKTRLIDEQVDGRRKSCWDNITCLTVAVAVGFVL